MVTLYFTNNDNFKYFIMDLLIICIYLYNQCICQSF